MGVSSDENTGEHGRWVRGRTRRSDSVESGMGFSGLAVVGAFMVSDSVVEAIPGRRGGDTAAP
jgi:hypothetical protein